MILVDENKNCIDFNNIQSWGYDNNAGMWGCETDYTSIIFCFAKKKYRISCKDKNSANIVLNKILKGIEKNETVIKL